MLIQRMGQVADTIHIRPIKVGGQCLGVHVGVRWWRCIAVVHGIRADLCSEIVVNEEAVLEKGSWSMNPLESANHVVGRKMTEGYPMNISLQIRCEKLTLISLRYAPSAIGKRATVRTKLVVAEKNTMVDRYDDNDVRMDSRKEKEL
jgi:hypothetical protein